MRQTVCDRCGDIDHGQKHPSERHYVVNAVHVTDGDAWHLCLGCFDAFKEWLTRGVQHDRGRG